MKDQFISSLLLGFSGGFTVVLSLLLLDVLGENLVVLGSVFSLLLEAFDLASLG
jgi:hypothetical protein